jgi:hypothetical protein
MDGVEVAAQELEQLLRAVAAKGWHMLIRVDGERPQGVRPKIFTVAISAGGYEGPVRFDDAELAPAIKRAVDALDSCE